MRAFVLFCLFGTAHFHNKPENSDDNCMEGGQILYLCDSPMEDDRGFNKTINDTQVTENDDIEQKPPQIIPLPDEWEADDDTDVGFSKPLRDGDGTQDEATM